MKENYDEKNYDPEVERLAALLARVTKRVLLPVAIVIALVVVVLLVGCHKENTSEATLSAKVTVTVNDFTISQEEFPETKDTPASYSGVKAMTLAFFDAQGNEIYNTTQLRADNTTYTTFGEFELSLPLGSYTMVVLGYGSEQPITLNGASEAIYTADRVRETFVASQTVNVASTNPLNLNAELSRVVSKVIVRSTDTRTVGVDSVRVTFAAGGKGVNPQTGLASSNNGLSNCVAISSAVGAASSTISYLFLASDQQTMNLTVETIKPNGTVYSTRTVADVPLQRNKITVVQGPMYSTASGASFTLSTSWIGDTNRVNF
jgi:hypothetical protein